jgi:tetrahydromethanopterin S-methyltransferase subunit B
LKPDIILTYMDDEFGAAEAGKEDQAGTSRKEVNERYKKLPKILKDMLVTLINKYPELKAKRAAVGLLSSSMYTKLSFYVILYECLLIIYN